MSLFLCPTQPRRTAAHRGRAQVLLSFWVVSLLLGVLLPCCDVTAAAAVDDIGPSHHDCASRNPSPERPGDGHHSVLDCDLDAHIGSADGPPADGVGSRDHHGVAAGGYVGTLIDVVADPIPPQRPVAGPVRGSRLYALTQRLRL